MMLITEMISVFALSGAAYGAIEILWRGHTHWTMLIVGGLCGLGIYCIATRGRLGRIAQYLLCAAVVTAVEFLSGAVINKGLGWNVWDYSRMPLNLYGQICALYSFYWLLLSIPACGVSRFLYRYVFGRY